MLGRFTELGRVSRGTSLNYGFKCALPGSDQERKNEMALPPRGHR
jgi:hypothetical protein